MSGSGPFVLALDLGSSSLRAARYDDRGEPAGELVRLPYPFRRTAPPGVFAPEAVADLLVTALDRVPRTGVAAIAVSSVWQTTLAVDRADTPVSPVYTWEADAAAGSAAALRRVLDPEDYRLRTGAYLHPSYPAAVIHHLRRGGRRAWRYTDLTSWTLRRVLGADVWWSRSLASGSGLWNQAASSWDVATLEAVGITPAQVGPVWSEPVVLPDGGRWPELAGVPVFPALGDGVCNNLGVGVVGPARMALNAGTSGSLRMLLHDPTVAAPAGLWRYRTSDRVTGIGGAVSNAGNLLAWLESFFGAPPDLSFVHRPPPAHRGLVVLPSLAGERGPRYPTAATGALTGLTLRDTREDFTRELILSSCAVFAELHDLYRGVADASATLVASGGVVRASPAWTQLLADAMATPVEVSAISEPSLRGAALSALDATGLRAGDVDHPVSHRLEPRPAWTAALRERRAHQLELSDTLR